MAMTLAARIRALRDGQQQDDHLLASLIRTAEERGVISHEASARLFQRLRDFDSLLAEPEQLCTTCQKSFDNQYDVYRCANCEMPFHRDCLRNVHFKEQVFPNEREELLRLRVNCSTFATENARLRDELTNLDTAARELLDNARTQLTASKVAEPEQPTTPKITLRTECCDVVIEPDRRFCPKCGQEARVAAFCEHGTATDVHCCNCHSGFLFETDHVCAEPEQALPKEECTGPFSDAFDCPVHDPHKSATASRPAVPAQQERLTVEDIDQIVEGIEHFIIGPVDNPELDDLWRPYINKLNDLRADLQRRQIERMNETTRLLDEERRRWYVALNKAGFAGDFEGLAPESVAKRIAPPVVAPSEKET